MRLNWFVAREGTHPAITAFPKSMFMLLIEQSTRACLHIYLRSGIFMSRHKYVETAQRDVKKLNLFDVSFSEGTVDEWRTMLNTNIVALCLCTQLAVKNMQEMNISDGYIIHINR